MGEEMSPKKIKPDYPCRYGQARAKHLTADVGLLSERWRYPLPEQRAAVGMALVWAEEKFAKLAKRARLRKNHNEVAPHYGDAIFRHASNAGACRIARELLEEIGGHP